MLMQSERDTQEHKNARVLELLQSKDAHIAACEEEKYNLQQRVEDAQQEMQQWKMRWEEEHEACQTAQRVAKEMEQKWESAKKEAEIGTWMD